MPGTPVEQIKEKLDISDFIKGYLNLQPSGKNLKGLCPFHREKTPSFMVSPDRQSWHCFGCNIGGDIFSFLMRYENIEFAEALKILAEKAGIELQKISSADYKFFGLLYDLNELAKNFYIKELKNTPSALRYLEERGMKTETIDEFEIGFAPRDPDSLNLYFINSGHSPDDVLRAGLAIKSDRGGQFDRFRGRVMFPIKNNVGKTVGFTGRVLPEFDDGKFGKYVNSPETPIFNKSKILYGFNKSKDFIRESNQVFLVEGQMDMIMSWQAGIKNVVASSGTALTLDHLQALRRLTDQLVLSFDNDEAGLNAGERAIDLAESMDFNVRVVLFKDFKDAAEVAVKNPIQLTTALAEAKPAPEFYFERYLPKKDADYGNREHLKGLRVVLAKLKSITSPVSRNSWLQELSRRTGLSEKLLTEESNQLSSPKASVNPASAEEVKFASSKKLSRRELICEQLLAASFRNNSFELASQNFSYLTPAYQKIFEILKSGARKSEDPATDNVLNMIVLQSGEFTSKDLENLRRELIVEYVKDKRQEITKRIKLAEAKRDEIELSSALSELHALSQIS